MKNNIIKRKINTVLHNPQSILQKILYLTSPIFSDNFYLKLLFPLKTGYKLNINSPKTYNEKLQWLKIHYRKPIMTQMVDKFAAKEFARNIIGDEYIVESYGVWDSFDEINFDKLPTQFVLKTTHDQGGVVIVTNKEVFDKKAVKEKLNRHLKVEHYYLTREWPYKNVRPRIMAEELLSDDKVDDLYDYKFYCFHGEPKLMYISHGNQSDIKYLDFFDMNFSKVNINRPGFSQSKLEFNIPENWELMKSLARSLSNGFPHLRVDFYNISGRVYLGELTFFQGGGMMPFYPNDWDLILGSWIDLEAVKKEINWIDINENS